MNKRFYTYTKRLLAASLFLCAGLLVAACSNDSDAESQLDRDIGVIEEFLAENNLTNSATQTEEGVFIVVTTPGTGVQAQNGDVLRVRYTGTFLDGTVFDSNVGRNAFEFTLGQGRVIQGWDIAFQQFSEGEEATIYIPSPLGYGRFRQGTIPPNSILVFDIELERVNP